MYTIQAIFSPSAWYKEEWKRKKTRSSKTRVSLIASILGSRKYNWEQKRDGNWTIRRIFKSLRDDESDSWFSYHPKSTSSTVGSSKWRRSGYHPTVLLGGITRGSARTCRKIILQILNSINVEEQSALSISWLFLYGRHYA